MISMVQVNFYLLLCAVKGIINRSLEHENCDLLLSNRLSQFLTYAHVLFSLMRLAFDYINNYHINNKTVT